uniref:Uncharacterized protein n=1 Tax=Arundo donax TaxID=35708 RepID=A0A0A9CUD9_ARUDO
MLGWRRRPSTAMWCSKSFLDAAAADVVSRNRFTAMTVPSSSTALYAVPHPPLPSISADARSSSSSSNRLVPLVQPLLLMSSKNTIFPRSNVPPAATTIPAAP